jgi:hypothetical protein
VSNKQHFCLLLVRMNFLTSLAEHHSVQPASDAATPKLVNAAGTAHLKHLML